MTMREAVLAALPTDADVSARQVWERVGLGTVVTTKFHLEQAVRHGEVVRILAGGAVPRLRPTLYRRLP